MPRPLHGAGPEPRTIARPWLGSYPPGVPPTYRYPDVVLSRFLDDAVRDFPEVAAVDAPGSSVTYPALADLVDRFAGAMETLGIVHGAPIGLLLEPGPAAVVASFAAWRVGAVVVPVDPAHPEAEVQRRLGTTGCRVVLTRPGGIDVLRAMRGTLPALHRVVVTEDADWQPRLRQVMARLDPRRRRERKVRTRDDVLRFADVVDTAAARTPQRHVDPDDVAALLFDRDGVPLAFSHRNLVAASFQSRLWIPDVQAGRERVLVAAALDDPQGLIAGMLDPILSAATIVVAASSDAASVAERIEAAGPTLLRGAGGLFDALAASGADLSSLRACLATSRRLDDATAAAFTDASDGARLRRAYGPVAGAGLTHANPVYGRAMSGAIGLPVSDTLAVVVAEDDASRPVASGEPGRLLVRGPQVTIRRWAKDGSTVALQEAGWLDTGDRARVDDDGWFTLLDADGAHPDDVEAPVDGILGARPARGAADDEDAL